MSATRPLPVLLLPLLLLLLLLWPWLGLRAVRPASADEPAVDAPGSYAGRDAAWWVEELRGAGTSRAASEALKIIGAPALPEIAKVLNHRDPTLRDMALGLLRDIPGDLRAAAPQLGQALERPSNELAAHALLELASRLGSDGASLAQRVLPFLDSESASLRGRALGTLERIGGEPGLLVPALRRVLAAPSAEHHVLALRVLVKLGPAAAPALPEVLAILTAATDAAPPATRRGNSREREIFALAVLQGLGQVGADGRRTLVALIQRPDLGLAPGAAQALARLSATEPAAASDLIACLAASDESSRSAALQALTNLRPLPSSAQQALLAMIASEDQRAVNQALAILPRVELSVADLTRALVSGLGRPTAIPGLRQAWTQLLQSEAEAAVLALPHEPSPLPRPVIDVLLEQAGRATTGPARVAGLTHLSAWLRTLERPDDLPGSLENVLVVWVGAAPEAWPILEPLLRHERAFLAHLAAGVVARAEVLRPQVLALLVGPQEQARRIALGVLRRQTTPLSPEQDRAVVALLSHADPLLRERAAAVLLEAPGAGARNPNERPKEVQALFHAAVLGALRAPEAERRSWGVAVAHGLLPASQEAIDALLPLLGDDALTVAAQGVAQALARAAAGREEATCTRLLAELERPEPLRASGAAVGLVRLGCHKDRVRERLPGLLTSTVPGARLRALSALRGTDAATPEIEAGVRALVRDGDRSIALSAIQLLPGRAQDLPAARAALLEVARDASCAWRDAAVAALGQLGTSAADDLVDLLAVPALRNAALYALRTLGPHAHDVLPRLEAELARTPADQALQSLVTALRRGGEAPGR